MTSSFCCTTTISGIAPPDNPDIRRTVSAEAEKQKQLSDPRHSLHGHIAPPPRLKSRRSFLQHTRPLYRSSTGRKETRTLESAGTKPFARLKGRTSPWSKLAIFNLEVTEPVAKWSDSLYRYNLKRWGYVDDELCDCGAAQTNAHLLTCGQLQQTCTQNDLPDDRALYVAEYWKFKA
ncbi:hypothetical protein M8J77_022939 [Diaphorina citri]|nr:hypothetical protein M8J77_022939 [Diaphorina citri]